MCLLVLLAGCTQAPEDKDLYRDSAVPLSVTTRGTLADLKGAWVVRGAFPETASIQSVTLEPQGDGRLNVTIEQPGCEQDCHLLSGTWPAERIDQNRMRLLTDSATDPELWVIWMDEDVRTAIIATPDGSAAFILDRTAKGGADRIKAAREIMDFNGYDISALQMR